MVHVVTKWHKFLTALKIFERGILSREHVTSSFNRLWAIDANWRHIRNVRYGQLTPNGVKAAFSPFFVLSTRMLHSTSGLWLATNRRYSVKWVWLTPLSKPLDCHYDRPGRKLNQQSYSHGAWFIAGAIDHDYLRTAALWSQPLTQTADSKTATMLSAAKAWVSSCSLLMIFIAGGTIVPMVTCLGHMTNASYSKLVILAFTRKSLTSSILRYRTSSRYSPYSLRC